jgi:3-phenylpropionate/trans-cinnamate dioxygenase ferredoxin component
MDQIEYRESVCPPPKGPDMPEGGVKWHAVCDVGAIPEEDVLQFVHEGKNYAIYHTTSGFYATDGLCTHEDELLSDGLVLGEIIECPRHQGRFHIPTGEAQGAPVCVNLKTYPTKIEGRQVYAGIPDSA